MPLVVAWAAWLPEHQLWGPVLRAPVRGGRGGAAEPARRVGVLPEPVLPESEWRKLEPWGRRRVPPRVRVRRWGCRGMAVGEERLPRWIHGPRIGLIPVVHLLDQPLVGSEVRAGRIRWGHGLDRLFRVVRQLPSLSVTRVPWPGSADRLFVGDRIVDAKLEVDRRSTNAPNRPASASISARTAVGTRLRRTTSRDAVLDDSSRVHDPASWPSTNSNPVDRMSMLQSRPPSSGEVVGIARVGDELVEVGQEHRAGHLDLAAARIDVVRLAAEFHRVEARPAGWRVEPG